MSGFIFTGAGATGRRRSYNLNDSVTGAPISGQSFAAGEVQVGKNTLSTFTDVTNIGTIVSGPLGSYEVEFTATEVNTVGPLYLKVEKAGFYSYVVEVAQVVSVDHSDAVRFGLTALPNAAAEAAGGLYTRGSGAGQINQDANGRIDTRTVNMATDVVTSGALAASAVTEIQAGLATSAEVAAVQADTDNIQTRLPAALVSGRMDSSVGAMAAGTVTAAAIATDAIDGDAIAASAVTEIQAGLALSTQVDALEAGVADIQARIPAVLVAGRIDASVGAMAANVLTAAATAADYVTEVQSGLATSAALATVQADTDNIQTRLPAALVGGRMDSSVGAMAADVLTAAATAPDFGAEVAAAVDVVLSAAHGSGAWGGGGGGFTPEQIADAVWNALRATHVAAGSFGEGVVVNSVAAAERTAIASAVDTVLTAAHGSGLWNGSGGGGGDPNLVLQSLLAPNAVPGSLAHGLLVAIGSLNTNVRLDQFAYTNGRLTGMRKRVFANGVDAAAGTNPISTALVVAVNGADGPTSYQAVEQP